MSRHTFTEWLNNEFFSVRCVLLKAYEKRDELLYIEGPSLEREYMARIGHFEEDVIKEEIETELLQKKKLMIQTAINRHEPIDETAIDAEIDKIRADILKDAEGEAPKEFADLNEEQLGELSELYKEILSKYQPSINKNITETQKQLFNKANEAFRKHDLEAMKLIYDMLKSTQEEKISLALSVDIKFEDLSDISSQNKTDTVDYALASKIYNNFKPTEDEIILKENIKNFEEQLNNFIDEIDKKRTEFPYSTAEMLSDEHKLGEYRAQLEYRLNKAKESRKFLESEIKIMIEGVTVHG